MHRAFMMNTAVALYCIVSLIAATACSVGDYQRAETSSNTKSGENKLGAQEAITDKWETSIHTDKMTSKKLCLASSEGTKPTEKMGFPYQDTIAMLGIERNENGELASIGFSESPNVPTTDIGNGYNLINTRIKWDDSLENVTLIQEWGAKTLHFKNRKRAISKIAGAKTVMLELNWYNSGRVHFNFSLNGASEAIDKIRKECRSK